MISTIVAPNPGPFTLTGTCTYIVDGSICVDPGPAIEAHIEAIVGAAPHLRAIAVTHRHADHAPAADLLALRLGIPIYSPAGVCKRTDHELRDDYIIDAGVKLRAIATPGHTREHFCFITDDGDLFTGDTVLGEGTTVIFPPDGHMGSYFATLQKLIALGPRAIYPGHGPVRHDAVELLEHYLEHRRERERQIEHALATSEANVTLLRERIYPDVDPRLFQAAELQLESHLVHLREQGRVEAQGATWRLRR